MILLAAIAIALLAANVRAAWIDGGRRTRGGRS